MRIVFAMPGNEKMADTIVGLAGFERGQLETRQFPDGETYLRVLSEVRGKDAEIVCTLARPDAQIMPLLLVAGALREWGATKVGLTAPYLAYMRQDAHFQSGEALSAVHFARLVSAHFDSLTTIDPHLHRIQSLNEIYSIPTRTAQAAPLLGAWIASNVERPILIGPDIESRQWVAVAAARANAGHLLLTKTRKGDRDIDIAWPDLSAAAGRTPVLVDDIASSGRTLVAVAEGLAARGLGRPVCVIVHALVNESAYADLLRVCARVVSADSVPHASNAISVAELLI
jgi:ribose-phosphate pyrophosphokinase